MTGEDEMARHAALADGLETIRDDRLDSMMGQGTAWFHVAPGVSLLLGHGLRFAVVETVEEHAGLGVERTVLTTDRLVVLRDLLTAALDETLPEGDGEGAF